MKASPAPLRQFFRKFLLFQFLILASLVGLTLIFTRHFQDRLARQLADALREPIVAGDIRSATLQMAAPISRDFRGATWKPETSETLFSVPANLGIPNAFLYRASIVPIYFDEQNSRLAGSFYFYYPRWTSLPIALAIWLMLLVISIPVVQYENKHLSREYELMLQLERRDSQASLAAQVAHDIRSPLAALEIAASDVSRLPEDKRIMIRSAVGRIRDIANSLLDKKYAHVSEMRGPSDGEVSQPTKEAVSSQLLSSLIESIVTEKRLQFRSDSHIEIEAWRDAASYGIFAQVQAIEFKRLLSNLINNAVESFGDESGSVRVNLSARDGRALVNVQDNGKGIPPEILAKLGQRGETYGKAGGSGLGLFHARTAAESWGGGLRITSELGKGTVTTVDLPLAPVPQWFVSELTLYPSRAIVILDDDTSIHQVWQGRLDSIPARDHDMEIVHVSTPEEIRNWVKGNSGKAREALYLLDYELLGYRETGLFLAEELAIGERSVLVTSRYEEPGILEGCRKLKARMIPKGLAGLVPIRIEFPTQARTPEPGQLDAVLIDDDHLTRMMWKADASEHKKRFRAFSSVTDFLKESDAIDKRTPLYIDVNLGNGVSGVDESVRIHELGFSQIYLTTGHAAKDYAGLKHLRGVIGKAPPWGEESST